MDKRFLMILAASIILPLAFFGCKGKVEKAPEAPKVEEAGIAPVEEVAGAPITEPARDLVVMETIPPTAAPEVREMAKAPAKANRNKDIQKALKNAGFYTGAIDGKIGPKTKNAIVEFQKAKGLKADGKVGPKTWAALEKYLT